MRGHRYLFTSTESGVSAGWHRDTSSIVGCSYGPCPLWRSSIILAHVAEPQKCRGVLQYGWGVCLGETAGQPLASTLVPHPACGMITHAQPNLGQPKRHQLSFSSDLDPITILPRLSPLYMNFGCCDALRKYYTNRGPAQRPNCNCYIIGS